MATEVILPKLGVTMTEGRIDSWLKKEGEYVNEGEALYEIETDKAVQEVESPVSGYLKKIIAGDDVTLTVNTVIAIIGDKDEDV